jgi:hypothetical protein
MLLLLQVNLNQPCGFFNSTTSMCGLHSCMLDTSRNVSKRFSVDSKLPRKNYSGSVNPHLHLLIGIYVAAYRVYSLSPNAP